MPENINDTPATAEQDALFKTDPTHNRAKPYSQRQAAANREHMGRTMLYHKDHGDQVFTGEEQIAEALKNGWQDTPFVHPNCPDAVAAPKADDAPDKDDELTALWAEVDRLDIKPRPHKFTGKAKLMEEIEKASG